MKQRWFTRVATGLAASVVTLGLLLATPAQAASAQSSFVDVSPIPGTSQCNAFSSEIEWLASQGISTGWDAAGGKEYRPYAAITRDAMAAFLYRYAKPQSFVAPAVSPFTDVNSSTPFYTEITWLSAQGISTGWDAVGGKQYRPDEPISREAMAAFLYRYSKTTGFSGPAASPFRDVATSNAFYTPVTWLSSKGISTGWAVAGGKEFRPKASITRDAMAAFLYRYDHPGVAPSAATCAVVLDSRANQSSAANIYSFVAEYNQRRIAAGLEALPASRFQVPLSDPTLCWNKKNAFNIDYMLTHIGQYNPRPHDNVCGNAEVVYQAMGQFLPGSTLSRDGEDAASSWWYSERHRAIIYTDVRTTRPGACLTVAFGSKFQPIAGSDRRTEAFSAVATWQACGSAGTLPSTSATSALVAYVPPALP